MDRIDLQVAVNRLRPEEITANAQGEETSAVRQRVQVAREISLTRFVDQQTDRPVLCNAQMQSADLQRWCKLDDASRQLLEKAIERLGLSARASDRIIKVARTIADLAGEENLRSAHIAEAVQYRTIDRMQ
jgi:magnesium chelatase family protein